VLSAKHAAKGVQYHTKLASHRSPAAATCFCNALLLLLLQLYTSHLQACAHFVILTLRTSVSDGAVICNMH
jgi:hypothetical protein